MSTITYFCTNCFYKTKELFFNPKFTETEMTILESLGYKRI